MRVRDEERFPCLNIINVSTFYSSLNLRERASLHVSLHAESEVIKPKEWNIFSTEKNAKTYYSAGILHKLSFRAHILQFWDLPSLSLYVKKYAQGNKIWL